MNIEEIVIKKVLTTYKDELHGKPNFQYIESFINEEVISDIVKEILIENNRLKSPNEITNLVFLKLEYLGLPYKWENYYVDK